MTLLSLTDPLSQQPQPQARATNVVEFHAPLSANGILAVGGPYVQRRLIHGRAQGCLQDEIEMIQVLHR
jgi:hypothetical protein